MGRFAFDKTPRGPRCARQARQRLASDCAQASDLVSHNQVLMHAARAAAKQLNFQAPLVAARGARRALVRVTSGGRARQNSWA